MCGIFCSIACKTRINAKPTDNILTRLHQRGPDSACDQSVRVFPDKVTSVRPESDDIELCLSFYSTVLALRGETVVAQPLCDANTNSRLCWNGEAWAISDKMISGNDTNSVFKLILVSAARDNKLDDYSAKQSDRNNLVSALMSIKGPFAFVFYDYPRSRVLFGRDFLGRRSLLYKFEENYFALSSVSDGTSGWKEVEADGIYMINLCKFFEASTQPVDSSMSNNSPLYGARSDLKHYTYESFSKYPALNRSIPNGFSPLAYDPSTIDTIGNSLRIALELRARNILVPHEQSFKNRLSACKLSTGKAACDPDLDGLEIATETDYQTMKAFNPKVAVLFSGGLDCTLIARMLHDLLPKYQEIDLLNVAFQNPRLKHGEEAYELCPDRITSRASHAELTRVCGDRLWRLVEINVSYAEAMEHRSTIVSLIYPHITEMDLSIAFALYFASRGVGACSQRNGSELGMYETPARVLFSGLGADELFGGYQRHATAFNRNGLNGLFEELQLDISRLSKRNLGRDDRIISHWGKEVRYPYLDDDFVKMVVQSPITHKTGFGQEMKNVSAIDVEPAKMTLRLLALKLGMASVAREKKRAIQFGARTAKLEGRTKGTQLIS